MLHIIVELLPFLAGVGCGLQRFGGTARQAVQPRRVIGCSLVIGLACALIAGELAQGLVTAISSIAIDSATTALGWLGTFKLMTRIMA